MKTASGALITLLNTNQFIWADLYTFTLIDGTVLRYTSADSDLVVSGNTFSSVGPYLQRGPTKLVIGIEVDTLSISFLLNSGVQIGSIPLAMFARNGGFDGARLKLERVFMATWGDTSAGTLINFVGRVAETVVGRSQVDMSVNSDLELLNIMLPRNVYQAGCLHSLYDSGCTLNPATYTVSNAATAGSTNVGIVNTLAQASGYFDLGTITFTSGVNLGVTRTIKSYTVGYIIPSLYFPYTPGIGDTFTAKPGCDKLYATCGSKFSNTANFRGYPTIPVPETIL